MSVWLQLLNEIKRRPPEQLLTPTQRTARDQLLDLMRYPQWINLYGKSGTGKTLVAWAVARACGAAHLPLPSLLAECSSSDEALLIDNAPHEEADVRRLLSKAEMLRAVSVVLITCHPITMPMKRVELALPNPADLEVVYKSLGLLNYPCQRAALPSSPNLWDVLQACI